MPSLVLLRRSDWVAAFFILLYCVAFSSALREFRLWSDRHKCDKSRFVNYPFAYSKYVGQVMEPKGRVNSNQQDFRHQCEARGGYSKCNICEDIICASDTGTCHQQLQGVDSFAMSQNIPQISDHAWAVNGRHRHDYGGDTTTHYCVMITGGSCFLPGTTNFQNCITRCFGYHPTLITKPAKVRAANPRSVVDVYPGMHKWKDDGEVDLWTYPRNCSELKSMQGVNCTYNPSFPHTPNFNPQGFTFTAAGSGTRGFVDGPVATAQFNSPEDVAVDSKGVIYVADTGNNAIRMIANGQVTTLAGKGSNAIGFKDGPCNIATFSAPKGLDVRIEEDKVNNRNITIIIVADTGNHRIRRIEYNPVTLECVVKCFTGLCGNNSLSATDYKFQAQPLTGYADGQGFEARFSSPESVTFMDDNYIVVADTGNFLLRWVADNGTTWTLAGTVVPGQRDPLGNPLAGCTPPCLNGQKGYRDGNLTYVQFMNILDVTRGPNNTLWIADEHRIRLLELPNVITTWQSIESMGRVSTIAGSTLAEYTDALTIQGHDDGISTRATFFNPSGLFVTSEGIVHIVDSASCKVRRITPMQIAAQKATCSTRAIDLIRPSGCTSYDQTIDKVGMKASRVEANIQYNYGDPYSKDRDRGKYIKNCVGSPPRDILDKRFVNITGDNLVIDDYRTKINEDSEQGTAIIVFCPSGCQSSAAKVYGTDWYSDMSSICVAAIHAGILTNAGGYLQYELQRLDFIRDRVTGTFPSMYMTGANRMPTVGIWADDIIEADTFRVFKMEKYHVYMNLVHTIAGHPMADLENGCGFFDGQGPMQAYFNRPTGVAAKKGTELTHRNFLYIADANNHRIRGLSAVCTQICENGGLCVKHDTCQCRTGWKGLDCATPVCNTPCGTNKVCTGGLNTCSCKPGYTGANCDVATCIQSCRNGGTCSAPDTCSCPTGWFDSNCTVPVCPRTCANGGNCTAPNRCACPLEWTGLDCRIPVCKQNCSNGGMCVAPDTCICPPQWTGHDCSLPVCQQGFFKPNSERFGKPSLFATSMENWPTYKYCNLKQWCNYTKELECGQYPIQQSFLYDLIVVPSGPYYRHKTGRRVPPTQCMIIELPISYKIPFELLRADGSTTGHMRYSPNTLYQNNPSNPWRGYEAPTLDHTGPWTYKPDRQLAYVNWINMTQGVYVCANNGNCSAPDVCECAPGWSGFDCRTPVCDQGYWHPNQETFVSGENVPQELERFEPFMGNNSYRLNNTIIGLDPTITNSNLKREILHMYSNPNFTINWEFYNGSGSVIQQSRVSKGKRYLALADWASGQRQAANQGGYRCSVRAVTEWENKTDIFLHPNYYSKYMDTKVELDFKVYSDWVGMRWPPVHYKSKILDQIFFNITFTYTNEGYRRMGIWNVTGKPWVYGICLMEFDRNCTGTERSHEADFDLESRRYDQYVQDTDLAFRPRITYDDYRVYEKGRWDPTYGQCIDEVIRGCYNNGTCVAPNTCKCADGWRGYNCNVPICTQTCAHNGNCTGPNTCTCERGWSGYDCSIPVCAQECQNGGVCVAPDVCKCYQWDNRFRDGRLSGGRPLYQDDKGNPLPTGWTGFDCSVPICVQSEFFYVNTYVRSRVDLMQNPGLYDPQGKYHYMGGHGPDHLMNCTDRRTGSNMPRCPQFDAYVTSNDGTSFQSGCGFDPLDTGCCVPKNKNVISNDIVCYFCPESLRVVSDNTFECREYFQIPVNDVDRPQPIEYFKAGKTVEKQKFKAFTDSNDNLQMCGKYHSPRSHNLALEREDYGEAKYYKDRDPQYSSYNYMSNLTSNRFLCKKLSWEQGDYIDDAGMANEKAVGSLFGLKVGRHVRTNFPNIIINRDTAKYTLGPRVLGEGVYACGNKGSCIGPDLCTCTDGYSGVDCFTPLCRHLQPRTMWLPDGAVTGCLNGGICAIRDQCVCIQTESVSWRVHTGADRGKTGWTGSDCSIPICTQGFFDPYCTDLKQAPAGEGCFRCSNGGNCTAPDICTCAPGWKGYDCRTPVCEAVADPLTRTQLGTVFEDKVISFEEDPCSMVTIHGLHGWNGRKYTRGNCTLPNQCTCLCKLPYSVKACKKLGLFCDGPWQDPMASLRNLLLARGVEYSFGSTDCAYGYEGNVDEMDRFYSCHQTVFLPSGGQRDSVALIVSLVFLSFVASVGYYYISAKLKKRMLLAKIERRRSKRSSEESLTKADAGAFMSK